MKKVLLTLVAAAFIFGSHQEAKAVGADTIINYVVDKAKSLTSKSGWQDSLCKKASFLGLKYSLRSASGVACKESNMAAFALALCAGYGDFDGSSCDKNARKIHKDDKKLGDILTSVVEKDPKVVGKAACLAAKYVPQVDDLIGTACK